MKKLIAVLLCLWACWGLSSASAANIKDYPTVAVMNFGNKAVMSQGLRDTDFSAATEYAIYQLSACGWFDLVDYEQLSAIAKMQRVQMSGLIDPSTAVQVGKVLGAQFMIIGNLTGLTTKDSGLSYQHGRRGSIGGTKHTVTANVSMRIVDIETGRIVVAGLGKGSSASTRMEVVFKKYRRAKRNVNAYPQATASSYDNLLYRPSDKEASFMATSQNPQGILREMAALDSKRLIPLGDGVSISNPDDGSGIGTDYNEADPGSGAGMEASGSGYPGESTYDDGMEYEDSSGTEIPYNEPTVEPVYGDGTGDAYPSTSIPNGTDSGYIPEVNDSYNSGSNQGMGTVPSYNQVNDSYYDVEEYKITIGGINVDDVQVRNAISKAVRDCIYGKMGLMTTLNGGKQLKIKTGF